MWDVWSGVKRASTAARDRPLALLSGVVLAALASVPVRVAQKVVRPVDDVYITLSYARSLAKGNGFRIFPTAPPTLGTTSPLNAILLSLPARLFPKVDLGPVAVWASVLAWVATGWLWLVKGRSLGLTRLESFVVAVLVTVELPFCYLLGFEHKLLFLLVTAALVLWAEKRWTACGIVMSLGTLVRAEAILMVPAVALVEIAGLDFGNEAHAVTPMRERLGRFALGFTPLLAVWALYAQLTTGHVLPATLTAKIAQVWPLMFAQPFLGGLTKVFRSEWTTLPILHSGIFEFSAWLALGAVGFTFALAKRRRLLPLAVWATLFAVGYGIIGAPFYPWYSTDIQYVIVVFGALGIAGLASIPALFGREELTKRVGAGAALASCAAVTYVVSDNVVPLGPMPGINHADYKKLAEWVNENTPTGSRVGYYEMGYLSWYSRRQIVDLLGLTDNTILPTLFLAPRDLGAAFRKANVDYYIDSPAMPCRDSVLRSGDFLSYSLVARIEGESRTYQVFERGTAESQRRVVTGAQLHGENWGGPERTADGVEFQWMTATRSTVDVALAEGGDATLHAHVLMEIVPGLARGATLRVDGAPIALRPIPPDQAVPFTLCSEPIAHLAPGSHTVEFTVAKTTAPADLDPASRDQRPLGVALDWIALRPAGEGCH